MGEQDIGDLEKIRSGIEGWLQNALPGRPGLTIADLSFPKASGESSVTLILDATWSGGGAEKMVFRMAPPTSQVFEKHDLLMQFQMMTLMAKEGLPAPALIGYEPDTSILGSDFYVMEFCDGLIPPDNPPFHAVGWVKDEITAADREKMWRTGLEVVAAIHRIDLEKYDLGRLPRAAVGEPILAQELRTFGSMFKPERRRAADPVILEGWELLEKTVPQDGRPALCWGDSRVGNVIFRDWTPIAILDWEMATYGDPLMDLGTSLGYWIDPDDPKEALMLPMGPTTLAGNLSRIKLVERYAARSGRNVDRMLFYYVFGLFKIAVIAQQIYKRFKDGHTKDQRFAMMIFGVRPQMANRVVFIEYS